jgi:hypothetical protein
MRAETKVMIYYRRLSEKGALTATLNWYRAVDDDLTVPTDCITVRTLYIWGSEDKAHGGVH